MGPSRINQLINQLLELFSVDTITSRINQSISQSINQQLELLSGDTVTSRINQSIN